MVVLVAMSAAMAAAVSVSEAGRGVTLVIVNLSWVLACAASGCQPLQQQNSGFPCVGLGSARIYYTPRQSELATSQLSLTPQFDGECQALW
jgi:hypothetical protein